MPIHIAGTCCGSLFVAAAAEDDEVTLPSSALPTPPLPPPRTPVAVDGSDFSDATVCGADASCTAATDTFAVPTATVVSSGCFVMTDGRDADSGSAGLLAALLTA